MGDENFNNVIPVSFPRHLVQHRSIDLEYCWDKRLANPYLRAIYKDSVSWAERWYHEIRHYLNAEEEHPLLQQYKADTELRKLLIVCCQEDLRRVLDVIDLEEYNYSAEEQLKKLRAWLTKFWVWDEEFKDRGL